MKRLAQRKGEVQMPSPTVGTRTHFWRSWGAWGGGVFAVSATQAVCQAEQRPADGPTLFPLPIVFALKLANQSLRDQFQIAVKFQMIFLCVAAAAASAPTTLRSDQRCNRLLVGGCAVGPSEGAVQQNKRTKSEGKTHGPPTQVGQFGVDTTSTPRTCSQVLVCSKRPHGLRLSPPADNFSLAGSFQTPLFRCKICFDAALDIGAMDA